MTDTACRVLAADIALTETDGAWRVRLPVDPTEDVFAGHYPGNPILPGVCIIETVHRAAKATSPDPVVLAAVESTRFLGPVSPGDVLTVDLRWEERPDGARRVVATAATDRGDAATVKLRYRGAPC